MSTRDEVISISLRIHQLRTEISKLSALQRELRQAEAELDDVLGLSKQEESTSLVDRILEIVNASSREIEPEEVIAQLGEGANPTSVRSALARLNIQGRIGKSGRGRYHKISETALSTNAPPSVEDGGT